VAAAAGALVCAPGAAAAAPSFSVPAQLRLVNYYPAYAGWTYMWQRWDPAQIDRDFGRIQSLNANAVRVIVQTNAFGFPTPTVLYRRRLARVLDLASAHGLRVELTLFDWWRSYGRVAASERWARALLAPYGGDAGIACIELQNELDPGNADATAWARTLLPYLRTLAAGIPVTVSVSGVDPVGQLALLKQELGASQPDFWTIHYYDKSELAYETLAAAKAVAAPLPLFVGETGYFAADSDPPVRTEADIEDEQARYLRSLDAAATALALPAIAPWILSDFAPGATPTRLPAAGYHFGLFRVDGTPKPAAAVVRSFFAAPPDATFNGDFEQAEAGLPRLEPAGWRRRGAGEFALDGSVSHGGTFSASIGSVRGYATARATLSTTPPDSWISPGEPVTLSAWVQSVAATGTTRISLLWFDGSRDYLGRTDSPPLPTGTNGWTQLVAQATAPPDSAYLRIELGSDGNLGRVWFDDVTLTES
jgi:hypothetical protein